VSHLNYQYLRCDPKQLLYELFYRNSNELGFFIWFCFDIKDDRVYLMGKITLHVGKILCQD